MLQYVIEAHSVTANQTIRQVSLANQTITPETNQRQAEQTAASFAHTLNSQRKLSATDWQGRATLKDLGSEFTSLKA
jgi:hypothetical protein